MLHRLKAVQDYLLFGASPAPRMLPSVFLLALRALLSHSGVSVKLHGGLVFLENSAHGSAAKMVKVLDFIHSQQRQINK